MAEPDPRLDAASLDAASRDAAADSQPPTTPPTESLDGLRRTREAVEAAARSSETGATTADAGAQGGGDLRELARLIEAFDQSTSQLKTSHDLLQERVRQLSDELARKNEELTASLGEVSALKNYLANILESATDGIIAIDPDRRVVAFNQSAAEAVLAIAMDQMGRPIADVLPEACAELGLLLVRALTEERRFTNVEVVLEAEHRRTLSVSAGPIRNEGGDLLGAVLTFRDLTEYKRLEDRAQRQERLAALGQMAAGVAHEIRNPLGGIELFASNLRRRLPEEGKEHELAGKILSAATSLNRIVTDMLTFTRNREPSRRPIAAEATCRRAVEMAASALEATGVRVDYEDHTDGARLLLDPDLLAQAFLNVVLNAAQVMTDGGTLTVRCRWLDAEADRTATPSTERDHRETGEAGRATTSAAAGAAAARGLEIAFLDTGPGLSDEAKAHLFHPFYTTRKEGTGLGLAIVHKLIQDHGGTVHAENRPEGGAAFVFTLPLPEASE